MKNKNVIAAKNATAIKTTLQRKNVMTNCKGKTRNSKKNTMKHNAS